MVCPKVTHKLDHLRNGSPVLKDPVPHNQPHFWQPNNCKNSYSDFIVPTNSLVQNFRHAVLSTLHIFSCLVRLEWPFSKNLLQIYADLSIVPQTWRGFLQEQHSFQCGFFFEVGGYWIPLFWNAVFVMKSGGLATDSSFIRTFFNILASAMTTTLIKPSLRP